MANKIILKKSSVVAKVPQTTDLDYGELAINYADEKIYFKNASNVIKSFSTAGASLENLTIGTGLTGTSYNGTSAVTIAIDSTVATLSGTQTLTNKTISGASNTLSNIPNSALTNSSVTINGTAVSLGGSATVTAAAGTLTGTTLNTTVVSSSLTSVGTITSGTWSGSFGAVSGANLTNLTAGNLSGTIPSAVLGNSTAYVGTTAVALNRASANQALTGISSVTLPGSTSGSVQIIPTAAAGTGTVLTLPATTGTVVTTGDTGTVTNAMLAGSITNAKLANSTISGVALGSNLNALTIGTGLSGTSYNGSGAVTIAIDSTVATLTGTQTLTNKTLTDSTTTFQDETDNTKKMQFQLSGITTGTTRTLTVPNVSGTIITTGDTGTVTSTMIADGTIVNADINASAAIAVSKLAASTISGVTLGNNLNTLTLNVSGTGLSGSTTYNGSAAATFTVTSNATSANTASAIVARDASGNFSAGTITATLSGNASTATSATTATNLAGGSAGTIPYQTAAGTTAMLAAGTSGYFLKSNNTSAPSWVELSLTDLPDAWVKKSVRVATTANITLSGTQTIDGVAVVAGDRVLVKDQTTASQNGIYVVAAGAWSRATDANTISKLAGALVNVDSGTSNGGFRYDSDLKATDTLDTTAVNFYRAFDSNDAATANTASKLVLRDASGNFSAGTITAALSGNASTATTLATGRTIGMTGDVTWTSASFNGSANVTGTSTLATVNSNVGTFGSASAIPVVTVNAKGLVTAASTVSLTKNIVYGTRSGNVTVSVTGASSFTVSTRSGNVSVPISL